MSLRIVQLGSGRMPGEGLHGVADPELSALEMMTSALAVSRVLS